MKHISFGALCAVLMFNANAFATPISHLHADGVTMNNIAVMQHSIMLNAFNNFDGSMAGIIERHAQKAPRTEPVEDSMQPNQIDRYGEMLYYGEYGDDGTVFSAPGRGRSGGDGEQNLSLWLDWQHAQDYAKFDNFKRIDSNYDLISLGFADEFNSTSQHYSKFGGFGGVALGREKAPDVVKLSETGEYVGLYYAYHVQGLTVQAAGDFGAMFTDAKSDYSKHDFTNLWAGAGVNASYDIFLDETSVLQPALYLGYTWIRTNGYEPTPCVAVDNFHIFEVSPALRAITHITDGWYGAMSARYVFNFSHGGDIRDAGVTLPDLESLNYYEYGLSAEKSIDRFNFAVSVNRRDGGRTGWNGNIRMKYMF
ncbi:MAG: autotransporter domain-containing protein [Alphaproteobacteria bacterium]|nr:autotransporter domain-containing protein [Alphaproteobacteria bacterium]